VFLYLVFVTEGRIASNATGSNLSQLIKEKMRSLSVKKGRSFGGTKKGIILETIKKRFYNKCWGKQKTNCLLQHIFFVSVN